MTGWLLNSNSCWKLELSNQSMRPLGYQIWWLPEKKSGGLSICVDLCAVNRAVIPNKYLLPTSEELTTQFYGSTVLSKLDLHQGYLQVPFHPNNRDLTAFVTHARVFHYTRVPFGLSSAPSCFQKVMSSILAGISGVAVYLANIIIHRSDGSVHDEHLHRVFAALDKHNLTLNCEKCVFTVPNIEFVRFRLGSGHLPTLIQHRGNPSHSRAHLSSLCCFIPRHDGVSPVVPAAILRHDSTALPAAQKG